MNFMRVHSSFFHATRLLSPCCMYFIIYTASLAKAAGQPGLSVVFKCCSSATLLEILCIFFYVPTITMLLKAEASGAFRSCFKKQCANNIVSWDSMGAPSSKIIIYMRCLVVKAAFCVSHFIKQKLNREKRQKSCYDSFALISAAFDKLEIIFMSMSFLFRAKFYLRNGKRICSWV